MCAGVAEIPADKEDPEYVSASLQRQRQESCEAVRGYSSMKDTREPLIELLHIHWLSLHIN